MRSTENPAGAVILAAASFSDSACRTLANAANKQAIKSDIDFIAGDGGYGAILQMDPFASELSIKGKCRAKRKGHSPFSALLKWLNEILLVADRVDCALVKLFCREAR
jgi:hypothetical protein